MTNKRLNNSIHKVLMAHARDLSDKLGVHILCDLRRPQKPTRVDDVSGSPCITITDKDCKWYIDVWIDMTRVMIDDVCCTVKYDPDLHKVHYMSFGQVISDEDQRLDMSSKFNSSMNQFITNMSEEHIIDVLTLASKYEQLIHACQLILENAYTTFDESYSDIDDIDDADDIWY